jgi:hypothetical protein
MTEEATNLSTEPPWCESCHTHIIPMGLAEYCWSGVCWFLVMHWPDRFFMSRPHAAILPWAGNIAYRCTCWSNQRPAASLRAMALDGGIE